MPTTRWSVSPRSPSTTTNNNQRIRALREVDMSTIRDVHENEVACSLQRLAAKHYFDARDSRLWPYAAIAEQVRAAAWSRAERAVRGVETS